MMRSEVDGSCLVLMICDKYVSALVGAGWMSDERWASSWVLSTRG